MDIPSFTLPHFSQSRIIYLNVRAAGSTNKDMAMGQIPVPPVNIPIPTKMDENGWCTYPKIVPLVLTHSRMTFFQNGPVNVRRFRALARLDGFGRAWLLFTASISCPTPSSPRSAKRRSCSGRTLLLRSPDPELTPLHSDK